MDNLQNSTINWFPGHMVKAINEIKGTLKLIDIVLEIIDSRLPISSRNSVINDIVEGKPRIIVMNKCDLADKAKLRNWQKYFEEQGFSVICTNAQNGENIDKIICKINEIGDIIYVMKNANKKLEIKPVYKVAVIGIPNVGKSTIINKLSKKNSAKVSNRPGVTIKNQWIKLSDNIQLLDTPGILWPNLSENNAGVKLALTGNIKREILDSYTLATQGIDILCKDDAYRELLINKYKLSNEDIKKEPNDILEKIALNRGCIMSNSEIDYERVANMFLDDFKNGRIGRVVLD